VRNSLDGVVPRADAPIAGEEATVVADDATAGVAGCCCDLLGVFRGDTCGTCSLSAPLISTSSTSLARLRFSRSWRSRSSSSRARISSSNGACVDTCKSKG
jgi:hypothetical protein